MNSWPLKLLAVGNDSECVYRAVAATLRLDRFKAFSVGPAA